MSQNIDDYIFYFKVAYTDKTYCYNFSPNISIKKFIETVKNKFIIDYESIRTTNYNDFVIIEAGQYDNINSRDPELAPPIVPSDILLREIYGNNWKTKAFYIRFI